MFRNCTGYISRTSLDVSFYLYYSAPLDIRTIKALEIYKITVCFVYDVYQNIIRTILTTENIFLPGVSGKIMK